MVTSNYSLDELINCQLVLLIFASLPCQISAFRNDNYGRTLIKYRFEIEGTKSNLGQFWSCTVAVIALPFSTSNMNNSLKSFSTLRDRGKKKGFLHVNVDTKVLRCSSPRNDRLFLSFKRGFSELTFYHFCAKVL